MIYTVCGCIKGEQMGKTLSHEHFKWEVDEDKTGGMYFEQLYDEAENQVLIEKMLPFMMALKSAGCGSIVEASPPFGGQNLRVLKSLSEISGVHIIPCTGMNLTKYSHHLFGDCYIEVLSKRWIRDFEEGLEKIGDTVIRPGYMKLLNKRGMLCDVDRDMLTAAAIASNKTGMPIHCHILEAVHVQASLDVVKAQGTPLSKFVWAHADHDADLDVIQSVIDQGGWVGFDSIHEDNYVTERDLIKHAIANGYEHQILLSQDYDIYEESLKSDGINRYTSLLEKFVPFCIEGGIDEKKLEEILTVNPSKFYDISIVRN